MVSEKTTAHFNPLADYLLTVYAASLKVLTSYRQLEDIDVAYELSKSRDKNTVPPVEQIINEAVKIAHNYLIPTGIDSFIWKTLTPEERFFIKGLDLEKNGINFPHTRNWREDSEFGDIKPCWPTKRPTRTGSKLPWNWECEA